MPHPELSLVIPTLNERENVAPLMAELAQSLKSITWEAIVVDDGTDSTDAEVRRIAAADARVRLLHRDGPGLSLASAVVDGFALARGAYVCVLDADLQHPPARIPAMLNAVRRSGADIVVASRYIPGGSAGGLASPLRRFYSIALALLARACFPRRLARISDPLGGYFLVRREIVQGVCLRPLGYKVLLEVLIRCRWRVVREVPYQFRPRRHGLSKADLPQGILFLRHLARLVWSCSPALAPVRMVVRSPSRRYRKRGRSSHD
jgi:dolichol-phosphate mannosyltransferase